MKCDSPVYVKAKVDEKVYGEPCLWKPVPCGHCLKCRMQKCKSWSARCITEAGMHKDNCFLTLTYDDEHLPPSLDKKVLQDFLKRFRKQLSPLKIRYFACGEYGSKTLRPHYHLLVFGLSKDHEVFKRSALSKLFEGKKGFQATLASWPDGNVFVGDVNAKTTNYVAGYVMKKQLDNFHENEWYEENGMLPPFVVMSRKPGIGGEFVDKFADKLRFYPYLMIGATKIGLPRYVDNRLYGDDFEHKLEKMKFVKKELDEGRAEARRQGVDYKTWLVAQQEQRELNIATKLKKQMKGKI